jgi:chromosome segregation ATPase
VVALLGTAFTLIQQVRDARGRVKGASKTLDSVSSQLQSLENSLALVRNEKALQTAAVAQQVTTIGEVAEELRAFLDELAAEQQKKASRQLIHALKSGDKEDKQLQGILDRLDRARDELVLRISVAQVGLVGNLKDGFRVAFGVLTETNEKVKEVLGTNLVLAERLKGRPPQQTGTGRVRL